jgi:putative flippase GtrA
MSSMQDRAAALLSSSVAMAQAIRFGAVGTVGFLVDAGVLWLAMRLLDADPYSGRALSFFVAVSTTFALNRSFTFRDRRRDRLSRRWAGFVAVNGVGGVINYTTYALLIATVGAVAAYPVLGVAAGSLAGFAFNFTLSRRFVFVGAAA